MKKKIWILVSALLAAVLALGACSALPGGQEPNVWVVTKDAPVLDSQGAAVGTAYPGFALTLQSEQGGRAVFRITEFDDKGEQIKDQKEFSIDTAYMEKQYKEPQAVIEIISVDMIKINPGASLYNESGDRLIIFDEGVGPFSYIQKTDLGYMFTIDFNIVYAREDDVAFIKLS